MPTIFILNSIRILIYFDDHMPPHFHAEYNEHEELIEIMTLKTCRGKLPVKQRKRVIEWASENQEFLILKWNEFNPNK
ncbi:MAG: DUF4160 domain-containing protein [Bacteroidia bacterium]